MTTRLLFLPKYGPRAASTRYRFLQYLPLLEQSGFSIEVSWLLDDHYLDKKFTTGRGSVTAFLRGAGARLLKLIQAGRFDLAVLNYELFPFLPTRAEQILLRQIPYVCDYDDAIFHSYDASARGWVRRLWGDKIRTVMAGARGVIAGNPYLADYAAAVNPRVALLPTAIDLTQYPPVEEGRDPSRPFTVGWVGSPSTAAYLRLVEKPLADFCSRTGARFMVVGAGPGWSCPGGWADQRPWAEETEVQEIRRFDVGIMPLPDTPWARGKCGFKLIQYLACGMPVIASPVGVNADIVEPGVNGFLAVGDRDWVQALEVLSADEGLRQRLGQAGRRKVQDHYSLQVIGPRLVAFLRGLLADEGPRENAAAGQGFRPPRLTSSPHNSGKGAL